MKNIFILILTIYSTLLFSQNKFEYLGTTKNGMEIYANYVNSNISDGILVQYVWVKTIDSPKKVNLKNGKSKTVEGNSTIALIKYLNYESNNLGPNKYILKKYTEYNSERKVVDTFDVDDYEEKEKYIIPGTSFSLLENYLSNYK